MGGCMSCEPSMTDDEESEPFIPQDHAETRAYVNTDVYEQEIAQLKSTISGFEKQVEELKTENQSLATRNTDVYEKEIAQLKFIISGFEKQVEELKTENQSLATRLSKICSDKLTNGNPNIADLSDPNRPDKLAEHFSELYDNQWTDSFQVLCERLGRSEEDAVQILLNIILTVYDLCIREVEYQNKKLGKALSLFTGVKDIDQADETVLQESLHNLRSFRAKKYNLAIEAFKEKIGDSLQSTIGSDVYIACQDYIAEGIKICWNMCVKVPSMYISAKTEEDFDNGLYTNYTKSGKHVSYVVWPILFQYEQGPMMKKGIAQGIN